MRSVLVIRILARILLLIGFLQLGHAVYDWHREVAAPILVPRKRAQGPVEAKSEHPVLYQSLLQYEWLTACGVLAGGFFLRYISREMDRL